MPFTPEQIDRMAGYSYDRYVRYWRAARIVHGRRKDPPQPERPKYDPAPVLREAMRGYWLLVALGASVGALAWWAIAL